MGQAPEVRADRITWTRGGRTILDAVSCTAPAGKLTGLIGPNGSGKTSLLSMLARLERPDAGQALLGSMPVSSVPRRAFAQAVAVVEQHSVTELELTVAQIVELGAIPRQGGWARSLASVEQELVDWCLEMAGITGLRERVWQTLSGGEKQKTQLARSLAQQPAVLLLDEPTNHLDVAAGLELMALARELGRTTVAAMHDLQLAAMYCDHLVVLRRGRVEAEGAPVDVLTPELLDRVYGVEALVQAHPRTGRPLVILCGPSVGSA
ncbi:ABC transporter ATP-binding protein [Tomitella biformata]|uniref:ABC transporter ATP-binding protein n=1 Tax=Tomitella biformata TaxID=630403 RepID=UPI0004654778